jgi:hypothetical protein
MPKMHYTEIGQIDPQPVHHVDHVAKLTQDSVFNLSALSVRPRLCP